MEQRLHGDELGHLALKHPAHRHAGGSTDDLGDVLRVDLLFQEALTFLEGTQRRGGLLNPSLEVRDLAVADGRGSREVGVALQPIGVAPAVLKRLLEVADLIDRGLLGLPVSRHLVGLLSELGQLGLEAGKALG